MDLERLAGPGSWATTGDAVRASNRQGVQVRAQERRGDGSERQRERLGDQHAERKQKQPEGHADERLHERVRSPDSELRAAVDERDPQGRGERAERHTERRDDRNRNRESDEPSDQKIRLGPPEARAELRTHPGPEAPAGRDGRRRVGGDVEQIPG